VAHHDAPEVPHHKTSEEDGPYRDIKDKSQDASPPRTRRCGVPKRIFYLALALVILLIVGLALGLGLGLGMKKKSSSTSDGSDKPGSDVPENDTGSTIPPFCRENPDLCVGGALGEQYYSEKGAFNGSGLALASSQGNIITLYFQHHTGDIRYIHYTDSKIWVGGSQSERIATDANNATPIATYQYSSNYTNGWARYVSAIATCNPSRRVISNTCLEGASLLRQQGELDPRAREYQRHVRLATRAPEQTQSHDIRFPR